MHCVPTNCAEWPITPVPCDRKLQRRRETLATMERETRAGQRGGAAGLRNALSCCCARQTSQSFPFLLPTGPDVTQTLPWEPRSPSQKHTCICNLWPQVHRNSASCPKLCGGGNPQNKMLNSPHLTFCLLKLFKAIAFILVIKLT